MSSQERSSWVSWWHSSTFSFLSPEWVRIQSYHRRPCSPRLSYPIAFAHPHCTSLASETSGLPAWPPTDRQADTHTHTHIFSTSPGPDCASQLLPEKLIHTSGESRVFMVKIRGFGSRKTRVGILVWIQILWLSNLLSIFEHHSSPL